MGDVRDGLAALKVVDGRRSGVAIVNGETHVDTGDQEDAEEAQDAKLHVVIVQQDVREVGGEEGVNPAGCADQVNVRVEHGSCQGSG